MSHERRFHAAEFTGGFRRDMQLPEQQELSVKTGLNRTCYVECWGLDVLRDLQHNTLPKIR